MEKIVFPVGWDFSTAMNEVLPSIKQNLGKVQNAVNTTPIKLGVKVGKETKQLTDILKDANADANTLKAALQAVTQEFSKMDAKGTMFQPKLGGLTKNAKNYVSVMELLINRVYGGTNAVNTLTKSWIKMQDTAAKAAMEAAAKQKIQEEVLRNSEASLSDISAKMDIYREKIKDTAVGSPEMGTIISEMDRLQKLQAQYVREINAARMALHELTVEAERQGPIISHLEDLMHEYLAEMKNTAVNSPEFEELGRKFVEIAQYTDEANAELQKYIYSTKETAVAAEQFRIRFSEAMADSTKSEKALSKQMEVLKEKMSKMDVKDPMRNIIAQQLRDVTAEYNNVRKANEELMMGETKEHQAFMNAVKQKLSGLRQNAGSMNQLNAQLQLATERLNRATPGTDKWVRAAESVARLNDKIRSLNNALQGVSMQSGSIDALTARLASLEQRWRSMSAAQKFQNGSGGELTVEAQRVYDAYARISAELQKQGRSLSELCQKESERQRILQEQSATLASHPSKLADMIKKEQALMDKLSHTNIGSAAFTETAAQLRTVREQIETVNSYADAGATTARRKLNAVNEALNTQNTYLGFVIKRMAAYASIYAVINFLKQIRDVTAEFEMQRVALGAILQDSQAAYDIFQKIKATAIKSPFEVKDLVGYTRQLSAYRIETNKLYDTTMKLADVSAGLGVDMDRLILAYGQVRAASVLRGTELRQFTEAGIPMVELLADKFTELRGRMVTVSEVFDLIAKRMVPFEMVDEIFNDMTSAGGMFYNMQIKQADTLKGKFANLKDAAANAMDEMGRSRGASTFMTSSITLLTRLLESWKGLSSAIIYAITAYGAYRVAVAHTKVVSDAYTVSEALKLAAVKANIKAQKQLTKANAKTAVGMKIAAAANRMYAVSVVKIATAHSLVGKSFWKMVKALSANPWAAIATAVITAGVALTKFIKNQRNITITTEKLKTTTDSYVSALDNQNKVLKQINALEELRTKLTELRVQIGSIEDPEMRARNLKEQEKTLKSLTTLSESLSKEFPGYAINFDINGIVDFDETKLNEKLQQEVDDAKSDTERKLNTLEEQYDKFNSRIDKKESKRAEKARKLEEAQADDREHRAKRMERAIDRINKRIDKMNSKLGDTNNEIARAKQLLNPDGQTPKVDDIIHRTWKTLIQDAEKYSYAINEQKPMPMFTKEEVDQMASVVDLASEVQKQWTDAKSLIAQLQRTILNIPEDADSQVTVALQEELDLYQRKLSMLEQLAADFGINLEEKATRKSTEAEKARLAALREELRTVKAIQKQYEEWTQVMTADEAAKKIKEIYGNVTNLNFLKGPEELKKRLSSIISQIKGVSSSFSNLFYNASKSEMSSIDNLTDKYVSSIKRFEGLRLQTYDDATGKIVKAGEKAKGTLTYGYGHSEKAPTADKYPVLPGMTIAKEEAEQILKEDLEATIGIVYDVIKEYLPKYQILGELTQNQFEAMVDFAFQYGEGGLRKALKTAGDSAEELAKVFGDTTLMGMKNYAQEERRQWRELNMSGEGEKLADEIAEAFSSAYEDAYLAVAQVDADELQKELEMRMDNLAKVISRNKDVTEFYKKIFQATGDSNIAEQLTSALYGDSNQGNIAKALGQEISDLMKAAGSEAAYAFDKSTQSYNWNLLEELIPDDAPIKIREQLMKIIEIGREFQAEQYEQWISDLEQEKSVLDQRIELNRYTEEQIAKIKADATLSEGTRKDLTEQYLARQRKKEQELLYKDFQESPAYLQMFENLDYYSKNTLQYLKKSVLAVKDSLNQLDVTQIKDLQQRLDEIDKTMANKNPFTTLSDALRTMHKLRKESSKKDAVTKSIKDAKVRVNALESVMKYESELMQAEQVLQELKNSNTSEEEIEQQQKLVDFARTKLIAEKGAYATADKIAKASAKTVDEWNNAEEALNESASALNDILRDMGSLSSLTTNIISTLQQAFSGSGNEAMVKYWEDMGNGIEGALEGIAGVVSGILQIKDGSYVSGIASVAEGVLNIGKGIRQSFKASEFKEYNKQIDLADKAIQNLERSMNNLSNAAQEAFGVEYFENYKLRMDELGAKYDALAKKIENERKKGKDANQEDIEQWEQTQLDIKEDIAGMETELSERLLGQSLGSAAREFASSWLEAYKSSADTFAAIEDKFNEMIENMVIESVLGEFFKKQLDPVFRYIDEMDSADMTSVLAGVEKIRQYMTETAQTTNAGATAITQAVESAYGKLSSSTSNLQGISKSIAGASEESILTLSAGINTQNFYISGIYQSVGQILAIMTGGAQQVASRSAESSTYQTDYTSYLENISDDTAAMRRTCSDIKSLLDKVILPNSASSSYKVHCKA